MTSFIQLVLQGKALPTEIDDYVDRWHKEPSNVFLHEYLGMSREQYDQWLIAPEILPLIIISKLHIFN